MSSTKHRSPICGSRQHTVLPSGAEYERYVLQLNQHPPVDALDDTRSGGGKSVHWFASFGGPSPPGLLQLTPTSSEISFNLGSRPSFIFRGVNLLNAGEVSHRKIGHSPGSGHTDASLGISVNQPLINPNFGYRSKVCTSTSKEKPTSGPVGDIHAKKTH